MHALIRVFAFVAVFSTLIPAPSDAQRGACASSNCICAGKRVKVPCGTDCREYCSPRQAPSDVPQHDYEAERRREAAEEAERRERFRRAEQERLRREQEEREAFEKFEREKQEAIGTLKGVAPDAAHNAGSEHFRLKGVEPEADSGIRGLMGRDDPAPNGRDVPSSMRGGSRTFRVDHSIKKKTPSSKGDEKARQEKELQREQRLAQQRRRQAIANFRALNCGRAVIAEQGSCPAATCRVAGSHNICCAAGDAFGLADGGIGAKRGCCFPDLSTCSQLGELLGSRCYSCR